LVLRYVPHQQAAGDAVNTEMLRFFANYLGSGEAAEEFLRGFASDLAVFEAAYALTPQQIDVYNANREQLRRDVPMFNWKEATRGQYRLDGAGMRAYVGARQNPLKPRLWMTFVSALDERGRYRGTVMVFNYRYPDPPGDAVVRQLVATARFDEPLPPVTPPATTRAR
jgi:hypothetical protein